MSRDPRATARACFELAAKGATEGERSAALGRGMAIVERHGLNPDHFDIPGRVKAKPSAYFEQVMPGDFFDISAAEAEFERKRASVFEELSRRVVEEVFSRGVFSRTPFMDEVHFTVRRTTAADRRDAEAAAKMDDYVDSRDREAAERAAERARRQTDEAVMREFRGDE